MIVSAIVLAVHIDTWWFSLATIIFIATRQNVLGLLMHEQCHRLAFHSKNGDLLCNLFAAYPLLVTLDGYRRVHLAHHQNYFTEHDPDYVRKQGKDWTFPQRVARFAVNILKDLSGLSTLQTIRGKGMEDPQAGKPGKRRSWLVRGAFYAAVAGTVTMFHGWSVVLLYWFIPLFTVLQLIVRWGAICEHKYNLVHPTVAESTPIIIPRWWERLLLPNLNFTFHIYHHWYPRVPFIHLTDVHAIFCQEGLVERDNVFHGYSSYLRYLFTGNVRSAD
jgi:fatty acid desaturase